MNRYGLTFHHLGLAVRAPERALAFLGGLGYEAGDPLLDPLRNVRLVLCTHAAMPAVEVIAPGDGPGPLDGILRTATEMLYHTCWQAASAEAALAAMRRDGRVVTVSPPAPAVLFGGRTVSFHYVPGFGLVEILEREHAA